MVKGPLHFLGREAVNQYSAIVNAHTHTQTRRGTSRTVSATVNMDEDHGADVTSTNIFISHLMRSALE